MLLLKNCLLNSEIIDILVEENKIIKVAKINEETLKSMFDSANIIDVNGKHVIPAYIDNHVHITGGGGEKGFASRVPEITLSEIIANGVTTVVGVLGTDTITRSVESLLAKTKALNEEGITAYALTGGYEYPSPTITGSVQKDIAYIKELIGVKMAISDHRCYNPTKEELIKLMSELRVAALISGKQCCINYHVGWGKGSMDVLMEILDETNIPPFLIRPTHISCTEKVFEQAQELAKRGAYIDITAGTDIHKSVEYILKVRNKGIIDKLTMSSDANGSVPIWDNNRCIGVKAHTMNGLHTIIKELVINYKIPLDEAIKILTINVAKALDLNNKGEIKEGKDADIIILDKNYDINYVIALGKIMLENNKIIKKGMYE